MMPANVLHEFSLSTLTDAELLAVAGEMGVSLELLRELRFVEPVTRPSPSERERERLQPRHASTGELTERQQGLGIPSNLADVAANLNQASDEFARVISGLEAALKRLTHDLEAETAMLRGVELP